MNNVAFEKNESIHERWVEYQEKHNLDEDIEVLLFLLKDFSNIARDEKEILAILFDAILMVLDSAKLLNNEQKTHALYLFYNLCSCEACQKDLGAHINKKGQIRISKKLFLKILNQRKPLPISLLELMYTLLHELLHGIFPEFDERIIVKKTEQVWNSGMSNIIKNKININK